MNLAFCALRAHKLNEEWNSVTQVARVFQIGPKESQAVSFLQCKISPAMVMKLREATRSRGLRQWLTHDMICRELFNLGFSSGQSGALCAWQVELTNGEDDALVS